MEVGAVKQAFNNEIIVLKKNLNQAKTQTIHKLTRKAKTLTEKKCPENLKDKLKRKAESAVREVLIIKKIKPRDIARFIVTHTGKLNDYLNKPAENNDRACARLLLHRALQEKYNHIRGKFSNISIKDLFMSRQERLKLKKEAREKQKSKKKGKNTPNTVNIQGEWDVENTDRSKATFEEKYLSGDEEEVLTSNDDEDISDEDGDKTKDNDGSLSEKSNGSIQSDSEQELNGKIVDEDSSSDEVKINSDTEISKQDRNDQKSKTKLVLNCVRDEITIKEKNKCSDINTKIEKKVKDNKNKNLKAKLQKRNFSKETDDLPMKLTKVADPFFVTSTGENYMSLVEPRNPDEVKEEHKQGNRQYRRAVMFGHVPKVKPKKKDYQSRTNFNRQDNFDNKTNNKNEQFNTKQNNFYKKEDNRNNHENVVPEKLHPSWEAKKKQSTILPFQGKKIVFN